MPLKVHPGISSPALQSDIAGVVDVSAPENELRHDTTGAERVRADVVQGDDDGGRHDVPVPL